MKDQIKKWLVPVIAVIGGIVFVVMGITNLAHIHNFDPVDVTVTQVEMITGIDGDGIGDDETIYYVHYEVDGKAYEEILQFAEEDYQIGDTASVLYDPEDPSYVTDASKGSSVFRICFGALFVVFGVYAFLRTLRTGR